MGVLSFLFDGKPPPSVTTYGSTTTQAPQWFSDYAQGVMNQADAIAAQPYQPYGGPRLAGFSPEQQQAFALIEGGVGKGSQYAQKGLDSTGGMLDTVLPTIGTNLSGAGRTFTGSTVGDYMNPYADNVTKRARELANRNFTETLMPSIQSKFTRAGQYGSTRMADTMMRGARDVSENLQSAADASLANAYTQGANIFASDAGRQGNLAQLGLNAGMQGSAQLGNLAGVLQQLGLTDAGALSWVGGQKQADQQKNLDLAYSDFANQRDYEKNQLGWLSDILHGIPSNAVPETKTTTETAPYQGKMGPSFIDSVGSLLSLVKGLQEDEGG